MTTTTTATVRVPVTAYKGWARGSGWTAEHATTDITGGLRAQGATKAEALASLSAIVQTTLDRAYASTYLVLHDDGTQSVCRPWGDGIRLDRVREGRSACSTMADWATTEAASEYALTHYGTGTVVRL